MALWSEDHPDLWVAMEKTRMYIIRGTKPEEPVLRCASVGAG